MPDRRRSPRWQLDQFDERFEAWARGQHPSDDLRIVVATWIFSRYDDPYQGVRREPGFDNLWFGPIPGAWAGRSQVVACGRSTPDGGSPAVLCGL